MRSSELPVWTVCGGGAIWGEGPDWGEACVALESGVIATDAVTGAADATTLAG